jgi:hypothetical protein
MRRVGTPIAISRSDNEWLKVTLIRRGRRAGGLPRVRHVHWFAQADIVATIPRFIVAGALSLVVGAGVAYSTNYLNQGVWTVGANGLALLATAFTAATAGPLVTGLLGKVYDDNKVVTGPMRKAKWHAMTEVLASAQSRRRPASPKRPSAKRPAMCPSPPRRPAATGALTTASTRRRTRPSPLVVPAPALPPPGGDER